MDGSLLRTKVTYSLLFGFVQIFCAEALSGSAPFAPLFPPFYAIYGIIDLLLLDFLTRRRVSSWSTVYLAGVILGYLTESFGAKVMWFGWPSSKLNLLGVLPVPEFPFLALFYHPVFSFCLPVYVVRRFFGYPLTVPTHRIVDWLLLACPLFSSLNVTAMRLGPVYDIQMVAVDAVIFFGLGWRLSTSHFVPDIRIGRNCRALLSLLLITTFSVTFYKMPPFGRKVIMLPNKYQVSVSLAFLFLLTCMLLRGTRKSSGPTAIAFAPMPLQLLSLAVFTSCVPIVMAVGIAMAVHFPGSASRIGRIVFLGGMLFGGAVAAISVIKSLGAGHRSHSS